MLTVLRTPAYLKIIGPTYELSRVRGLYRNPYDRCKSYGALPLTPLSLYILRDADVEVTMTQGVKAWYVGEIHRRELIAKAVQAGHKDERLLPFQESGTGFIMCPGHSHRVLLGDDPRLGKTVQSLVAMEQLTKLVPGPLHIFAPKALLSHWERSVLDWTSLKPIVLQERVVERLQVLRKTKPGNAYITNWETLRGERFPFTRVRYLIGDECHVVRNRQAQVTKAFTKLRPQACVLASATMIEHGAQDYFPLLRVLRPKEFTSYWRFVGWYCETQFNGLGTDIIGTRNEDLLHDHLAPLSLRRHANEVATVPPKQFSSLMVQPHSQQLEAYKAIETGVLVELKERTPDEPLLVANELARTVRLRQMATHPQLLGLDVPAAKLDATVEYVQSLPRLMQVVVFTSFRETASELVHRFTAGGITCSRFIGGDADPTAFIKGETRVLVSNPQIGGVGQDYRNATIIIFVDLPISATVLRQAIERTTAMGEVEPRLIISVLCCDIDRALAAALAYKRERITEVDIYQHIMRYLKTGVQDEVDTGL